MQCFSHLDRINFVLHHGFHICCHVLDHLETIDSFDRGSFVMKFLFEMVQRGMSHFYGKLCNNFLYRTFWTASNFVADRAVSQSTVPKLRAQFSILKQRRIMVIHCSQKSLILHWMANRGWKCMIPQAGQILRPAAQCYVRGRLCNTRAG